MTTQRMLLPVASPWPGLAPAFQNLRQRHRAEIPDIHPHIILAQVRLQPPMAVAMQVDRAAAHIVPGPERVVAEHEARAIDHDLAKARRSPSLSGR